MNTTHHFKLFFHKSFIQALCEHDIVEYFLDVQQNFVFDVPTWYDEYLVGWIQKSFRV